MNNKTLIESLEYHVSIFEEESRGKKAAKAVAGGAALGAGFGALHAGQKQVSKINDRVRKYVNKKGGHLVDNKIHITPKNPGELFTGKTLQQKVDAIGKGTQKFVKRTKGLVNKASLKGAGKGALIGAGVIGALHGAAALANKNKKK